MGWGSTPEVHFVLRNYAVRYGKAKRFVLRIISPIAERIEDVGEKIGDARKDVWKEIIARIKNKKQGIEEALKKSSAGKLFSSLFDEKELLESGVSNEVVTFISAVKGSLGTKPRSLSKLKMWINKVLHQYDMCEQALENWESVKKKIDEWKYYSQPFYMYRAAMAVGGYESGRDVGNAELWQIADGYSDGKSVAGQWCVRKAGAYDGIYKTYEEAAEALKKFAGENAAVDGKGKRKEVKLAIYKRRTDGTMFIAPEGKPDVIIQDGFRTLYEASAYKKEHYAEMQERVDEETGKHILYSRNKAAGHELTELTAEERELRDNLVERMRKGGLDVVTDSKEMQRVIDTENERTRMMGDKQKRALETATIAAEATNNATVISSADGAKIQNNLGTLATNYEKIANKTRGFITDLSHALGLKQHESSQYGTFETPDGKRITIRVSNHNARVSNFDKNNESEGISIVISSHKNKGLHNDGNAHIIEYFYPKRALENAEGKPLAEMIRSVSDALAGEEFKDTTGLAEREEVNSGSVREHRVYHGSGADFDAFDHSHMGDGEGAQAYGWGTYVTEVEGIGRTYANATAHNYNNALRPLERKIDSILTSLRINGSELDKARAGLRNAVRFKTKENYEEFLRRREEIEEKYGKHSTQYDDYLWNSPYAAAVRAIGHYENEIKERETELHSLQKDLEETRKQIDELPKEFPRHLYTVEIPDDNGGNYLDWNGHPAESLLKDVGSFLESEGFERVQDSPVRYEKGESTVVLNPNATGADLYAELREALGSDKKASQALAEVGCVGIKYPADNMRGGRKDGAKNYVIFNENDAKITDHTRFLRTADGEVYGLVKDGRIYLDPKVATAETAVHEYTHLWGDMLRRKDSEQWSHTVKELKDSVLWEEVKELYPELKTDDEIADEVLSTFSGRRGAERLREEARRVADGDGGVFTKAKAMAALERVKEAIARFWEGVARMFGINRHRSVEELADMAMRDLLDSKNPMKDESGMRKRGEVGDEGVKSLKGEEAMVALDNIFEDKKTENMPQKVSSLVKFMELFRKPVRTFLGEVVNVKEEVYNKIIREKRTSISGAVLPTLENADFAIRDTDGSTLYIKRFKSENNDNVYNIAVVNKYGEVEDYVSSVHIKSDNNLRNKITKGAELLLPQERITDGILPRNNSTPGAKVANYSETAKPRYSRKPGESIFVYASRVSEDVDRSVRERVSARDEYEKKVKSKGFQTKEALQNSMLGLQEFMYAIDHASGNRRYIEDIPDFENPILGENRLSSVNKEESHSRLDAVHSPTPTKGVRKPYLRSYTMIYMPLADIFFPRMYQAPDGFMAVRIQHMEFVIQTDETEFFL